jgi:hypothetical protein
MIGRVTHFQVSGLSHQVSGTGIQVQVQEMCPLSSMQPSVIDSVIYSALHSVLHSVLLGQICPPSSVIDLAIVLFQVVGGSLRWQVAGLFYSALHSVLHSVLNVVFRDQIYPPSSVIDSAIAPFQVAGGSPRWQVAGLFYSALHSVLHSVLLGQICPPSSVIDLFLDSARAARGAAPTPRQALPRYSILDTLYSILSASQSSAPPSPITFLTPKPEKATK